MRHRAHARLLAPVVALVMLLAVAAESTASEAFSVNSQSFRVTWSALTFEGAFGAIRCPVTVEGSFHSRTLDAAAGALLGYVTRAVSGTCASGTMTVLSETLPWHVQYASFSGTLPNITAWNLTAIGASIRVREPFVTCLGTSTVERPLTLGVTREVAGGNLTTVAAGGSIPTSCGFNGTVSGSGNITQLASATRIQLGGLIALGDIEIIEPIRIPAATREERVTIRYKGIGAVQITEIRVTRGEPEIFRITDPNICRGTTLSRLGIRECDFRVRASMGGQRGEVTITIDRRPGVVGRTRVLESL
ncbi:MAG TPA: hypothetical protein VF250_09540 [Conexibacter sp.]